MAAEQMRQIGRTDALILLEPAGRNAAPAIALGALEAVAGGGDPVLLVVPADHKISNEAAVIEAVQTGLDMAASGKLVAFGITPTHPETGSGYIRIGTSVAAAFKVKAFVEKLNADTEKAYIKAGGYYWNSGIFMFRASRYLEELEKFRPDILKACQDAFADKQADLDFLRFDKELFLACPEDSIDYAVMEKTDVSVVVPLDAGWSDIGSWAALWETSQKDTEGNCKIGDVLNLNGSGHITMSAPTWASAGSHLP